jgi:outer membrane protein assembly factor BamA
VTSVHVTAGGLTTLAMVVVWLVSGCRHKVVHHPGEEWLESINVEGNKSIKTKDLRDGLALKRVQKQGSSPDPYLVVIDGKRIEGEYIRRGFLEVDVRSRVERHGDKTSVIYTVQEGPRARTRVLITGIPKNDPDLTVDKVRDALPIKEGEPFSYPPYDDAKERMLGIIEDAGYAHAELNAHVIADRANHEAIIHLDYHVGPKCTFGTITVTGADGELADAVRARVAIKPGETYSAAAMAETQRRIYDMRRFSMVRVLPAKGGEGETIDVTISLAHSTRNELVTGGGLGMDPATYEIRARTGYSVTGWPFPLTDFSVDLRPAYAMLRDGNEYEPRIRAMAKLRRIDLFRPFIVGEVEGGYNYLTVEAYTSYGPRARLGASTPLGWHALQLRAGWEIERLDFRHISPLIDDALQMELGLDDTQRVGQYSQALALDLRDNQIEPTLGAYAEVRVDEGTPYAGGAVSFVRVTPELRGFVPAPGLPLVLAARARYGRIYGDIPVTERYFSGGATTQRGFSERHLAPSLTGEVDGSERTVPYGGAELVESNVEVRTHIGKVKGMGLGGVVFLDGADVVDADDHVDVGNLHWAAGVGLRLFTLVGAVRADFGYRLNRTGAMEPAPGDPFAFHLSIGEAF